MTGPSPEPDFPVTRCARCARDVLTHVRLDAEGGERRHCLHCEVELDPREIRWVLEPELERLGYALASDEVAGCGRPGCGQGRCGQA